MMIRKYFIGWKLYKSLIQWMANTITPSGDGYHKWERKNKWLRRLGIVIGRNVAIGRDFQCFIECSDNITIEDFCAIGSGVKVWNFNNVKIGRFSMLAADVTLVNGGHDKNSFEPFSGELVVGRGCWVGNGVRIVGEVTIGDNVIVGAGAVVLKDIPDGSIVAGVPARIIGVRELPEKIWHLGNVWFSPVTFEIINQDKEE